MRKTMTKEVTFTTCKVATIVIENGEPIAHELGTESFFGKLNEKKLHKEINKVYAENVSVYDIAYITRTYEMNIEDFVQHATIKDETNESIS